MILRLEISEGFDYGRVLVENVAFFWGYCLCWLVIYVELGVPPYNVVMPPLMAMEYVNETFPLRKFQNKVFGKNVGDLRDSPLMSGVPGIVL